ncbi:hypothetical protein CK203_093528 [Vitis vinifera]|uniref:Reverse transcriptase domain-containing protein n=1 Tax=Vitis vinifera TaxID=29760 RepID=A0A438D6F6_VITVI|nr:hypothetical protein CK203_093528 [Vitis vinifera]
MQRELQSMKWNFQDRELLCVDKAMRERERERERRKGEEAGDQESIAFRGLRQGDPLSPFLLTLVENVLSRLMIRAEETGLTEGFLWEGTRLEVSEWLLSYLGLPLGGNPKTIGFWDPVVERISRRLDGQRSWEVWFREDFFEKYCSLREMALEVPRKRNGLWHKVIASIYGTHPNGWDAKMVVRWSHRCPWKAIAQVFQDFSPFVRLVVGNGERIRFLGRSLVG